MKKYLKKFALVSCCSTMLVGNFVLSENSASAESTSKYSIGQYDQSMNQIGYNFLLAVEKLPSDVEAQGAEKIAEWLSNETGLNIITENDNLIFPDFQGKVMGNENDYAYPMAMAASIPQVAACVGAVGVAILSTAIPITKITKLKTIFNTLGGVTRSIDMIHTNYKHYRKTKKLSVKASLDNAIEDIVNKNKLGTEAKALLLDFFNLNLVAGSCAPLFD